MDIKIRNLSYDIKSEIENNNTMSIKIEIDELPCNIKEIEEDFVSSERKGIGEASFGIEPSISNTSTIKEELQDFPDMLSSEDCGNFQHAIKSETLEIKSEW